MNDTQTEKTSTGFNVTKLDDNHHNYKGVRFVPFLRSKFITNS